MNLVLASDWLGRCPGDTYDTPGIRACCDTSIQDSSYISCRADLNNGSMSAQSLRIKLWTVQHAITIKRCAEISYGGIFSKIGNRFFQIPKVRSTTNRSEECLWLNNSFFLRGWAPLPRKFCRWYRSLRYGGKNPLEQAYPESTK